MLYIGMARHSGPWRPPFKMFAVECVNNGGWLSDGDLALESFSTFLPVVEHRLIPAGVRAAAMDLKKSGLASDWAPACQEGQLEGCPPLTLPSFCIPGFLESFHLGRVLRVILPLASGRIAHLFVLYGYQGASEDPHKLALTNKLLQAVICEAHVCGIGQPVIIAGDFNVDPGLIPVVAKALRGGRLVDLEAAYAHGRGDLPAATCRFDLDRSNGTRRDFVLACPNALAASCGCRVLDDRWLAPTLVWCSVWRFGRRRCDSPGWFLLWPLLAGWRSLTGLGLLPQLRCRRFGWCIRRLCSMSLLGSGKMSVGFASWISGDFNVDPSLIPVVAKAIRGGRVTDLEAAHAEGRGQLPSVTCWFQLDGSPGTRRDFFLACPNALAACVDCRVLEDRWFRPHFGVVSCYRLGVWTEEVRFSRMVSPLAPACWLEVPDRSRYSASGAVQEIWQVYLETSLYVPGGVRDELRRFCICEPDVDAAWLVWCSAAENGFLSAYKAAGGPCLQGDAPFLRRGSAFIRNRRIGGKAPGRLHRLARADEVDVGTCESFINSSPALVVLFRRRLRSVGDVLKGIRNNGFTTARWQALVCILEEVAG